MFVLNLWDFFKSYAFSVNWMKIFCTQHDPSRQDLCEEVISYLGKFLSIKWSFQEQTCAWIVSRNANERNHTWPNQGSWIYRKTPKSARCNQWELSDDVIVIPRRSKGSWANANLAECHKKRNHRCDLTLNGQRTDTLFCLGVAVVNRTRSLIY